MNKITALTLILFAFLLHSCKEKEQKITKSEIQSEDTISKVSPVLSVNKKEDLSTPLDSVITKNEKLLFDIEGNYTFKDDDAKCKIDLKLYFEKKQLKYKIKTSRRDITANADIKLNEQKDGYYVTFYNLEWSENSGAAEPDGDQSEEDSPLPQEVEGMLNQDEIIIQNYGNAMNYYVKLGECDVKFIHLIRKTALKK